MSYGSFVHLHVHSEYSILDGACRVPALVARAVELEMPAVGLTDHGSMAGAIKLVKAARGTGVKAVIGCEVFLVEDRHMREARSLRPQSSHLTLLAADNDGYANLVKLSSLGYLEGYNHRPRIDWELLERHSRGVIALSGCLSGLVCKALEDARPTDAASELDRLVCVFGRDNVYVELQNAHIDAQLRILPQLVQLAKTMDMPTVATVDVHYLRRADAPAHEALLCVQSGDTLRNPNHWKFDTDEFFFKSPAEVSADFPGLEESLLRTLEVAERCDVDVAFGADLLPSFPVPNGRNASEYLAELCRLGIERRFSRSTAEVEKRLAFELATIDAMDYADQFLIVWDIARFARKEGITVGPGRGAGPGSLVAYLLGITDLDPIQHRLLFERFMNPGRKTPPFLYIDFAVAGREKVINYLSEKHGPDRVARIVNFSTMTARAAVREAGRVLEIPNAVVDRIAKLIPEGHLRLTDSMQPDEQLALAVASQSVAREVVSLASEIEGLIRFDPVSSSTVIIGAEPLINLVPLRQRGSGEPVAAQYPVIDLEALGFLTMDFMGQRSLDVIEKTVELAGGGLDMAAVPLDDMSTYKAICSGDSPGVFKLEPETAREAIRRIRPSEFDDLVALMAFTEWGPLEHLPTYANHKSGSESVTYLDPRLEPILRSTYGLSLFQEQFMEITKEIAGFSPSEADDVRKALGKRIHSLIASMKDDFLDRAIANHTSAAVAQELWEQMERGLDYAYPKSHMVCQALIAYRLVWLRVHYPVEYMAALISSALGARERIPSYLDACKTMGIEVLSPTVNDSEVACRVVGGKLRLGLRVVRGVGELAGKTIVSARDRGGPFTSIWDFVERTDLTVVTRRMLRSLVGSGALPGSRKGALAILDQAFAYGQRRQADRASGQASIFDLLGEPLLLQPVERDDEFDEHELALLDEELLGLT